ncbi:MAG: Hsp33 family molecular chaperone HslO [Acidobacteriota bacterium]
MNKTPDARLQTPDANLQTSDTGRPAQSDRLMRATAADNQLRCLAAITTNLVGEACRRHQTYPTASVALGRTLTGTLLLGSSFKDLEKITVKFDCDGPIGDIVAQADAHGKVRGYVTNPSADITAMNALGKFDVRAVVGNGTMYVQRDLGFEIGLSLEPYRGSVPIVSGEIGDDFAYYLGKSEQINSAVGLGVLMKIANPMDARVATSPEFALEDLRVAASGGFIIQMMPDTSEEIIGYLEHHLPTVPNPTVMVSEGLSALEMLQRVLGDLEITVLDERAPSFKCQCSRQRVEVMVSALGKDEVADMLAKDNGAEVICHYCNEKYQFSDAELQAILNEA